MASQAVAFGLLVLLTSSALHELEHNDELSMLPSRYLPRHRRPSKRRRRTSFECKTAHLSDTEFRRAFRLSRRTFQKLVPLLLPYLVRDELQGRRSSGSGIEPELRLGMTLRMLAADYNMTDDFVVCWALNGVPLRDEAKLGRLARDFSRSRSVTNPLYGCIAALDGIAITISKPPDNYVPRNFYCRKGMYALPVQAVVDSRYRFLYMSCRCSGSTHDSVAFDVSDLAARLRAGEMIPGYWIAADPAY
eukprot:IDg22194t1